MNAEAEQKTKQLFIEIGQKIRSMRQEKGLSLNELARQTGFAKSYLSQIENLKREPSISALSQVAQALGVDVLYLLGGEMRSPEDNGLSIVKKNERKIVTDPEVSPNRIELLSYNKRDRAMEAYIVTLRHKFPPKPFVHEGQELTYLLEGSIEFHYNGETYFFEEGDFYYFDSNRPHFSRSVSEKSAKQLVVFSPQPIAVKTPDQVLEIPLRGKKKKRRL